MVHAFPIVHQLDVVSQTVPSLPPTGQTLALQLLRQRDTLHGSIPGKIRIGIQSDDDRQEECQHDLSLFTFHPSPFTSTATTHSTSASRLPSPTSMPDSFVCGSHRCSSRSAGPGSPPPDSPVHERCARTPLLRCRP